MENRDIKKKIIFREMCKKLKYQTFFKILSWDLSNFDKQKSKVYLVRETERLL